MPSLLHPAEAGRESLQRITRLVARIGGELGSLASDLLTRHGYVVGSDGGGPHANVLGHPLFGLPLWVDQATSSADALESEVLLDICESSLCGYLSVRAEDDYFDQRSGAPEAVMMLAGFLRTRHQALLAPWVSDRRFWVRFESLWHGYGKAMLLERSLHDPGRRYGAEEFDAVLDRSQPLEIPGQAVLSIKGCWHLTDRFTRLVRRLTRATQLFDDFVDAPADLDAGNYTWMVRRLGGLEGATVLRKGMVTACDEVLAEAEGGLDAALAVAGDLAVGEMLGWVEARKRVMKEVSARMYETLFGNLPVGDQ